METNLLVERNCLLSSLPSRERKLLQPNLEAISLQPKDKINEAGSALRYIHFPIDSAISMMDMEQEGRVVEVAVVGMEGCTGFNVVQGLSRAPCRTIVQIGGSAFRLATTTVLSLLERLPFLQNAFTRFNDVLFRTAVISVGCSQFHSVEQRLGRWLLAHQHRTGLSSFPFTHDFLAEQLGVQRVTVTQTLSSFQEEGIVRYRYGEVHLLKPPAMAKLSCKCFPRVKAIIEQYVKELSKGRSGH
ncbi:MAG TPA: Crp/Fnr family transcriptional regulator [Candidatus Saccharimonadales bacterium]|nr:Crp/Fnr family transcriptional regulator [Candidatus Saccharimonadales bacterium]